MEYIPVRLCTITFIGMFISSVRPMPMTPAVRPMIIVSALKTRETSFFDAPIARRMPISYVRSSTLIYVMMPIMMEETTSDIATKAIRT